ncbi:metallophosphoesterase family protein [Alkalihalobacterium bogoriense]|uniref:metallophosphoesterase family protein n=1 Tax=Alkalihalobacterium bogoriense TaxID=246272 RepID=UPI00047CBB42|nr:metallophosphoesterase [Alkalihalobacterium bogoriense]
MKALIVSDSHGWKEELAEVLNRHKEEVDLIIHCGDSELHFDEAILKDVVIVEGNCDVSHSQFEEEIVTTIDGVTFYVTHGHLYNVKMTHVPISYRAEEVGASIACFGHSHIATSFSENGVVYINPGSLRLPRNRREQTYCLCEINDDKIVRVMFYNRAGTVIPELSKQYSLS